MAMLRNRMLHTGSKDLRLTRPVAGECHVWIADLHANMDISVLSPDELQRSARLLAPALRQRSAASRAVLRHLCAAYTGTAARNLRFCYGERGKPALDNPVHPLHFNLAHTGDLAVLAFTTDRAVGIDVEEIRPMTALDVMLDDLFSVEDQQCVRGAGEDRKLQRFLRCWTRMEARAKLTGDGLQRAWERSMPGPQSSLASVDISFMPTPTTVASIALQGCQPALSFKELKDLQGALLS